MTELIGKQAPDFSLRDKDGVVRSLKHIKSEYIVIYFYPKDGTPGCTIEAQEFNARIKEFHKRDVTILGISGGDELSKAQFCQKHHIEITLLCDPDFHICRNYKAFGEKSFMGKSYEGVFRKTYVLDRNKKVIKVWNEVSPKGHAEEVLHYICRHRLPAHAGEIENRQDQVPRGHSHKRMESAVMRSKASEARVAKRRV